MDFKIGPKCEYGEEHAAWWRAVHKFRKGCTVRCLQCGATWRTRSEYGWILPDYDIATTHSWLNEPLNEVRGVFRPSWLNEPLK